MSFERSTDEDRGIRVSRRQFVGGLTGAAGILPFAGCSETGHWWSVLQAVWENEEILAGASVRQPGGWNAPATVALDPTFSLCEEDDVERWFVISVTGDEHLGGPKVKEWIAYRHPCEPSRSSPTVQVDAGVYRVLVNSGAPGGDPLAEYQLQVSDKADYRTVDGGDVDGV